MLPCPLCNDMLTLCDEQPHDHVHFECRQCHVGMCAWDVTDIVREAVRVARMQMHYAHIASLN